MSGGTSPAATGLHGRTHELAAVEALSARIGAGANGVLLVTGGPGTGRTALLRHAARCFAGTALLVLSPPGKRVPWSGVRALLAAFGPGPSAARRALRVARGEEGVGAAVAELAPGRPLLLCVDDHHLWDAHSRAALASALRGGGEPAGVGWLVSYARHHRPPDVPGAPVVRLGPLGPEGAGRLLDDLGRRAVAPAVRARLLREAAGHPGVLAATARRLSTAQLAGEAPLPRPLIDGSVLIEVYGGLLDSLPVESRRLLSLVAVAGEAAGPDASARPTVEADAVLASARATRTSPEALDGLLADGLLGGARSALRFEDPFLRSAVLAVAPAAWRRSAGALFAPPSDAAEARGGGGGARRAAGPEAFPLLRALSHRQDRLHAAEEVRALPDVVRGRAELLRGLADLADGPVGNAHQALLLASALLRSAAPLEAADARFLAMEAAWAAGDPAACLTALAAGSVGETTGPHDTGDDCDDNSDGSDDGGAWAAAPAPDGGGPLGRHGDGDGDGDGDNGHARRPGAEDGYARGPRAEDGRRDDAPAGGLGRVSAVNRDVDGRRTSSRGGHHPAVDPDTGRDPAADDPYDRGGHGGIVAAGTPYGGDVPGAVRPPMAAPGSASVSGPEWSDDGERDFAEGMRAALSARLGEARGPLARVVARDGAADEPRSLLRAGSAALVIGDMAAAARVYGRALARVRAEGRDAMIPRVLEHLAYAELRAGRHGRAGTHAREGLRAAELTGQHNVAAHQHAVLALVASVAGDVESVEDHAGRALAVARGHGLAQAATLAEWALARAELGRGLATQAAARLAHLVLPGPRSGHFALRMLAVPCFVEAADSTGRSAEARLAAEEFAVWAAQGVDPQAPAQLARCRALLTAPEDSAYWYGEAMRRHDASGNDFERARTLLAYGKWLRRRRRSLEARGPLSDALVTFERAAAGIWADQARAELRATGGAAAGASGAAAPEELTPQQQRIAALASEGATNREIADRLSISPRTVDHHLRNVFARLGVRSRVELSGVLSRAARGVEGR
ncbi:LuxR C-terminal-related transcriptional regulator [Streptomyces sp. NPDC054861]